MHRIFRVKAYEAEHGPHFNEEHARKAVSKSATEKLKSSLYLRINQLLLIVHQVLLYLQINRKL